MIRQVEFERVLAIVDRSGVAAELEDLLRPEGKGGKPRQLSVRVLLTAIICVYDEKSATLKRVHKVLTKRLAVSYQYRLGIRTKGGVDERELTVRQVRYLFNAIAKKLDYSPHTSAAKSQEERLEREALALEALNRIVRASIPAALPTATALAIDATSIRTFGRPTGADTSEMPGRTANQRLDAWDRDGMHGHQTRTEENGSKSLYGYLLVSAASMHTPGTVFAKLKLIESINLIPANVKVAAPTIAMLDERLRAGVDVAVTAVDRGFSYAQTGTWAEELRVRGIEQIIDMHPKDPRLVTDVATGALMLDGWPHLPWTPQRLHKIERPEKFVLKPLWELPLDATPKQKRKHAKHARRLKQLEEFTKLIAERGKYALSTNGSAKANGDRPFHVHRHENHRATAAHRRTKIFTATTITIRGTVVPKLRQRFRWGSPKWIAAYAPRSGVESTYAALKSLEGAGIRRGTFRVVGLIRTSLMLALASAYQNLKRVRRWAKQNNVNLDDVLLAADPPDLGWEERRLEDLTAAPQAPPAAA